MELQRRNFIKKLCVGGVCFCGFGSIFESKALASNDGNKEAVMSRKWITELLSNLNNFEEEELRKIVKSASVAHYESLNMKEMLLPFIGKLDEFISFIEKEWGWKFSYQEGGKVLMVDENKSYCVCPLLKDANDKQYPALCYCSEGFAERMFSVVCEKPVEVVVAASVQRGDRSCVYRIANI